MRTYPHLMFASLAALALSACSPSTPASDTSASVSETAAATVEAEDTVVTESEASSAAAVVVTAVETYDPVVIRQMGEKPGYWEVKHTDPKTKKNYVTHVCVDKPLAAKMSNHAAVQAPADRRDYQTDANFKGACPTGVRGGDVEREDGKHVNAYGDRKPVQSPKTEPGQKDNRKSGEKRDNDARPDREAGSKPAVTPTPSHNPHTTPGEDHANDAPDQTRPRAGQNHN